MPAVLIRPDVHGCRIITPDIYGTVDNPVFPFKVKGRESRGGIGPRIHARGVRAQAVDPAPDKEGIDVDVSRLTIIPVITCRIMTVIIVGIGDAGGSFTEKDVIPCGGGRVPGAVSVGRREPRAHRQRQRR